MEASLSLAEAIAMPKTLRERLVDGGRGHREDVLQKQAIADIAELEPLGGSDLHWVLHPPPYRGKRTTKLWKLHQMRGDKVVYEELIKDENAARSAYRLMTDDELPQSKEDVMSEKENRVKLAVKKREFAKKLLCAGQQNLQIIKRIKSEFGSGIGPDALSVIRKSLGTSRKKSNGRAAGAGPLLRPSRMLDSPRADVLETIARAMLRQMHAQGIDHISIEANGQVRARKVEDIEFVVEQPA